MFLYITDLLGNAPVKHAIAPYEGTVTRGFAIYCCVGMVDAGVVLRAELSRVVLCQQQLPMLCHS